MAKMVSTIGAFVSLILSFLWLITLTAPWNWLWSQNALVVFKVNLFSIYLDHGIVTKLVKWTTGDNEFTKLLEQSMWIEQGVQELCMLDEIWKWCDTWHMVRFGSIAMAVFGFMVVIFLAAGGGFMYYYAQHHATRTGRLWVLTCVSGAPCCAAIGLLQYVVLTFQMGKGERNIIVGTEASYGSGFFFACTLTVFTFVPLYIHMVFGGADEFEKGGDGDNFEAAGQGVAAPLGVAEDQAVALSEAASDLGQHRHLRLVVGNYLDVLVDVLIGGDVV